MRCSPTSRTTAGSPPRCASLAANARKLAGEELPYEQEVELVYAIEPRWQDEAVFERAHRLLDEALPGGGDLVSRYHRWFAETAIPSGARRAGRARHRGRAPAALTRETSACPRARGSTSSS